MNRPPPGKRPTSFSKLDYPHQQLTGEIIGSAHHVDREFGFGFLESVYRRALTVELRYRGVEVAEEVPYELFHRGVSVGLFKADLLARATVMVEAKTGLVPDPVAPAQLLNCMCSARITVGLVVYFGPRGVEVKRVIASQAQRRRTHGAHVSTTTYDLRSNEPTD